MSYQKNNNGGEYQPIGGEVKSNASKKWIYGAVIVAIASSVAYFALKKSGGAAATDAAVAKAGLTKGRDGRLKLFDEHSK